MKVLVVDDFEDARLLLLTVLESGGYTVMTANNGLEALELSKSWCPNLIISDILMPKMDGFAFCRAIKKNENLKHIPFIFYTATYIDPRDQSLAIALGADRFLVKPMEFSDLLTVVGQVLESSTANSGDDKSEEILPESGVALMRTESLSRKLDHKLEQLEHERQALVASESRYRSLVDYAPVGIYEIDPQGNILSMNQKGLDIFGLTNDRQAVGRHFLEFVASTERLAVKEVLDQALKGRSSEFEWRTNREPEARIILGSILPLQKGDGSLLRLLGVAQDISERKKAETVLHKREGEYRLVTDNVPALIAYVDASRRYRLVNRKFGEWFGLSLNQIIGLPVRNILGEKNYPDLYNNLEIAFSGKTTTFETKIPYRDGTQRWVSATYVPQLTEEGNVEGVYALILDIDERKRAEAALRSSEERYRLLSQELEERVQARTVELSEVIQELESFSYSVSHDMRAPLRAIDGFSQAVLDDSVPQLDPSCRRYLTLIRQQAQNMGNLIDDLLTFSRLGRQALKATELDMYTLTQTVFQELIRLEPGRNVRLNLSPDLPRGYGDRTLVQQLLVNLLSNALKFSRDRDPAVIEIEGKIDGSHCLYIIRDNGVGFDMQFSHKLFDVFQRLHSLEDFEGTGVGLAIVQRVIRRHGGQVWGESVLNQGATFSFTLPKKGLIL